MNVERLNELAEHIEQVRHFPGRVPYGNYVEAKREHSGLQGFNMRYDRIYLAEHCGTAGCIAGHGVLKFHPHPERVLSPANTSVCVIAEAQQLLDLDRDQSLVLFHAVGGLDDRMTMDDIGPDDAARALRRLARGDALDTIWSKRAAA